MTLPTFLGIGAPRCGSTWLHELLASHPEVYVPTRRKEVRFFDLYYERGLDWYERFFPPEAESSRYRAIGEFSPTYLFCPDCPERIARVPSIEKLILILRNPVDRAYSRYGFHVRYRGFSGTFEDFSSAEPYALDEGYYSRGIKRFYQQFAKDCVLVLVYENAVGPNLPQTRTVLADFLDIQEGRFPHDAGAKRVNVGAAPKRGRAIYAYFTAATHQFQRWDLDLDWAVRLAKRVGLRRLFGAGSGLEPMKEETRQYLARLYEQEIAVLEEILELDLSCWRQSVEDS